MTTDTLRHVVDHVKRWRIEDRYQRFESSAKVTALTLRDGDLGVWIAWARTLDESSRLISGHAPYITDHGYLHTSGHLMSGHVIDVYVCLPAAQMRAMSLTGPLLLAEVEQYARKVAAT